jgi:hypothetical protein
MATNLTIRLLHRPGTLAEASEALGRAGTNIEGGCGYVCETGEGVFHVLVTDAERARRSLMDAGFEIQAERQVVLVSISNVPGEGAKLLRRIGDAGLNLNLLYMAADGRLVLGADNVHALIEAVR